MDKIASATTEALVKVNTFRKRSTLDHLLVNNKQPHNYSNYKEAQFLKQIISKSHAYIQINVIF